MCLLVFDGSLNEMKIRKTSKRRQSTIWGSPSERCAWINDHSICNKAMQCLKHSLKARAYMKQSNRFSSQRSTCYMKETQDTGALLTYDHLNKDPRELLVSLLRPLCKENKAHCEIGIHAGGFSKLSIKRTTRFPDWFDQVLTGIRQ